MKATVIGSGSWGVTLASLVSAKGISVSLWGRDEELVENLQSKRHHPTFASDYLLSDSITATSDLKEAVEGADYIFFVVPSQAMRNVAKQVALYCDKNPIVISFSKGFEDQTFKRMSEVLEEEFQEITSQIGIVSGPNHAEEIIQGQPAATLAAAKEISVAEKIQDLLVSSKFRVYTSNDVIGAELGGALKNVIALSVGVASGLGLGDNPKAALMTRGLAEIARLGVAMGAHPMTFTGLSGLGDLIATCTSEHSRNFRAGRLISQGRTAKEAQEIIGMVVEGIRATDAAMALAEKHKISMPIVKELQSVLIGQKSVKEAMEILMTRSSIHEAEEYFSNY